VVAFADFPSSCFQRRAPEREREGEREKENPLELFYFFFFFFLVSVDLYARPRVYVQKKREAKELK